MKTLNKKSKAEGRAWVALAKAARKVKQFMDRRERKRNEARHVR